MASEVEAFSMVLVLRLHTHHAQNAREYDNLQRFLEVGMPTYAAFLDRTHLRDFWVVVPSADMAHISATCHGAYPDWPWRIVAEDEFLHPELPPGWARQQTVKLCISQRVTTNAYLIIDDDTYLTKPFSAADLQDPQTGRYLMNRTAIDFPFFFYWSARILKFDYDQVQHAPCVMAITPEIFVTSVVKDMVRFLEDTYGTSEWQTYLADHKFTEYGLYTVWLLRTQQFDTLYATYPGAPELYGGATTHACSNTVGNYITRSFHNNKNYWFSFVQSSLPISVATLRAHVLPMMDIRKTPPRVGGAC